VLRTETCSKLFRAALRAAPNSPNLFNAANTSNTHISSKTVRMTSKPLKVLALTSYPKEAAATRFRVVQFIEPLAAQGIRMEVRPFLDSKGFSNFYSNGRVGAKTLDSVTGIAGRLSDVVRGGGYDLVFVQRESMFFGPEVFEWLLSGIRRLPLVLDLDDATYVRYTSPRFGRAGSALKFFGKTDRLIRRASAVTCGNRFIAEYAEGLGAEATVIPTVVDPEVFRPAEEKGEIPVLGWIGTHSTFPSIRHLFPVFEKLASKHDFVLRIVGSGVDTIDATGFKVENLPWELDREVADFRGLDIGLYPIVTSGSASEEWLKGKSGFKAVQYMAVGIPFVMTPVGVCGEMGVEGKTHFNALTEEDWYTFLDKLLANTGLRSEMGAAAREHFLGNFALESQANLLAAVFWQVAGRTE